MNRSGNKIRVIATLCILLSIFYMPILGCDLSPLARAFRLHLRWIPSAPPSVRQEECSASGQINTKRRRTISALFLAVSGRFKGLPTSSWPSPAESPQHPVKLTCWHQNFCCHTTGRRWVSVASGESFPARIAPCIDVAAFNYATTAPMNCGVQIRGVGTEHLCCSNCHQKFKRFVSQANFGKSIVSERLSV